MKELCQVTNATMSMKEGTPTFWLHLLVESTNTTSKFGGTPLEVSNMAEKHMPDLAGCALMFMVLRLFGVNNIQEIRGQVVYLLKDNDDTILGLQRLNIHGGAKLLLSDWLNEWSSVN